MSRASLQNGGGPGSSISLAAETIRVRNALIEKFTGEPLDEMNHFMNTALAAEKNEAEEILRVLTSSRWSLKSKKEKYEPLRKLRQESDDRYLAILKEMIALIGTVPDESKRIPVLGRFIPTLSYKLGCLKRVLDANIDDDSANGQMRARETKHAGAPRPCASRLAGDAGVRPEGATSSASPPPMGTAPPGVERGGGGTTQATRGHKRR